MIETNNYLTKYYWTRYRIKKKKLMIDSEFDYFNLKFGRYLITLLSWPERTDSSARNYVFVLFLPY
jgi:hypothetical protein